MSRSQDLETFMQGLEKRNPHEPEFHQAVKEVATDILPHIADRSDLQDLYILERMTEPDRIITFRVVWEDDDGNTRVNRGYRVQQNNAIGPYKGGLRFDPSVTQSILKFLAFEQVFKNSLTGLPLGGGKGGADFNPKGKSDREIMRFSQAFMTELSKYIGPNRDIPAGDIGVGSREIGYLFGQYKHVTDRFEGVLTGKSLEFGGSQIRTEATGYGVVYLMENVLQKHDLDLEGMTCCVSGAGNVSLHCAEKLIERGAKVLTLSDSDGHIYKKGGLTADELDWIKDLKLNAMGAFPSSQTNTMPNSARVNPGTATAIWLFLAPHKMRWAKTMSQALSTMDARPLRKGANMPTTNEAIACLRKSDILHVPGQGSQCRWGRGLRARDEPEQRPYEMVSGRGRRSSPQHHGNDTRPVCPIRSNGRWSG